MTKVITVTRRNGDTHEVLVDDDFECGTVGVDAYGYAYTYIKRKRFLIHRMVIGASKGELVDHINRNRIDNRKENLRIVTYSQNRANSTCHKGYSFSKSMNKWKARVMHNKTEKIVGYYDTKEEARQAYEIEHAVTFKEFSPYYKEEN